MKHSLFLSLTLAGCASGGSSFSENLDQLAVVTAGAAGLAVAIANAKYGGGAPLPASAPMPLFIPTPTPGGAAPSPSPSDIAAALGSNAPVRGGSSGSSSSGAGGVFWGYNREVRSDMTVNRTCIRDDDRLRISHNDCPRPVVFKYYCDADGYTPKYPYDQTVTHRGTGIVHVPARGSTTSGVRDSADTCRERGGRIQLAECFNDPGDVTPHFLLSDPTKFVCVGPTKA